MAGNGPVFRGKARFSDGRTQKFLRDDGVAVENERREILTVWDNDGKLGIRFSKALEGVIVKALGGKPGSDKVFFDLYDERGRKPGKPAGKAAKPARDEDEDDFDGDFEDEED